MARDFSSRSVNMTVKEITGTNNHRKSPSRMFQETPGRIPRAIRLFKDTGFNISPHDVAVDIKVDPNEFPL